MNAPRNRAELIRAMAAPIAERICSGGSRDQCLGKRMCGCCSLAAEIFLAIEAAGCAVVPKVAPDGPSAWQALVAASRTWAAYLDQWDRFKFQTDYGPVYVSIDRCSKYPDSFDELPPAAMLAAGPYREG